MLEYEKMIRNGEVIDGNNAKFFALLNDQDLLVIYDDHGYCNYRGVLRVGRIKVETISPDSFEISYGLWGFDDLKEQVEEEDLKIMFFESLNNALEEYHRAVGN